jgi:hypothetical protein
MSDTPRTDAEEKLRKEALLLPGLKEALLWKPNTPQLENAMTYAWEQALKSFIRAIEKNAPPTHDEPPVIFSAGKWVYMGDGNTPSTEHDSRELDAAAWHKLARHFNAAPQATDQPGSVGVCKEADTQTTKPAGAAQ